MIKSLRPLQKCAPEQIRDSCERAGRARFISARVTLGWSQLETSFRLGVHRSTVEDWERGATRLPMWALVALESDSVVMKAARKVGA
jgi:DNA-binding transcriptional regulator YiaG